MKRLASFLVAALLAFMVLAPALQAGSLGPGRVLLGGPKFDPRRIPGLVAWYDAADPTTVTLVSGNVATWHDKSRLGNSVSQGAASKQPSYGVATFNGRPVIKFDGADDNLIGTDTGLPAGTSDRTAFAVYRKISGNWGGPSYGNPSSDQYFGMTAQASATYVQTWVHDYNASYNHLNVAFQHTAILSALTVTQRTNGVQRSQALTTINTVLANFRIGSEQNAANFSAWEVAEYILYNRTLSAVEIDKVERYQRSPKRWGTP